MAFARARIVSLLLSRTPLRLSLFLLLAWLYALPIVAQAGGMNVFHDAQFLSAYERHARLSVLSFGQLPLWDPYSCGGMYGLAAPQTRYASPLFLFSLLLGVDPGATLLAILWPAFAMEGMFRYARSWGSSARAALVCAALFPLSGFFATAWHVGWVQFYSFCGLPWMLWGMRCALRGSRPGAYVFSVACLLTVGFGGTWTLPMGAPLFAFELADALVRRDRSKSFLASLLARARGALPQLLLALLLALSIGALRLWPMLESARATLRVMGGEPSPSFETLGHLLFFSSSGGGDFGAYYVTPLCLLSVLALPARRALLLWGAALTFAILALGHVTPWAPFALLRKLPVYDSMRYPERFLVVLAIVLSLLTARNLTVAIAWLRRRFGRRTGQRALGIASLLLACGLAVQIVSARKISSDVEREPSPTVHSTSFRQSRGNRWLMSHFAAEGMGSLGCGEAYPLPMSRYLRGDLKQEEYVRSDGQADLPGTVERLSWSPNALKLRVQAKRPLLVAINQNYHPGWQAERGVVESWDGLLSVRVPAGETQLLLRFRPRSGIGGFWVTVVALAAGASWAFGRKRSRRSDALHLAAGPLLWLAFMLTWQEEPWAPLAPTTPDGSPVYMAHLPEHAKRMRVTFDVPIVLEGARIGPLSQRHNQRAVEIDLFFRRTGQLPPTLGVFVFLTPQGRRSEHGDHSLISGVVYLPRLVEGQLARDAFRVAVPDNYIGRWQVKVGFWNAHGDGERRQILDAKGAHIADNMVQIGDFEVLD